MRMVCGWLIKELLDAVTRVTSLSPVPRAAHDNVVREMMAKNVKAEIYTGDETEPEKVYYVGGPSVDAMNTYMLLENDGKLAERPHMTYIPNFKGYITQRYSTDEENWRTRKVFSYTPDEIKAVSVEYPADERKSFTLHRITEDSFELSPKDAMYGVNEAYQQKYIRQYLDFYASISIEAFANANTQRDSTVRSSPYCIITVTDKSNVVNAVKIYHMPVNRRSKKQYDDRGEPIPYDIDHFYALVNNDKDFAIIQYYVFGKLLRSYRDFFFKPETASP